MAVLRFLDSLSHCKCIAYCDDSLGEWGAFTQQLECAAQNFLVYNLEEL